MLRGMLMRVCTGMGQNGGERAAQWRGTGYNGWKWWKTHGIEAYGVFRWGRYVSIPGGRKRHHGPGNRVGGAFRHGWEGGFPVSARWAKKCPDYSAVTRADYIPTSQNEKPGTRPGLDWGRIVVSLRVRSVNPPPRFHPEIGRAHV